jgi:predicted HicB family RNase H-like nuclease
MEKQHVTLSIRLPPELHEQLKRTAEREERSLNNLIVRALRAWVAEQEAQGPARNR